MVTIQLFESSTARARAGLARFALAGWNFYGNRKYGDRRTYEREGCHPVGWVTAPHSLRRWTLEECVDALLQPLQSHDATQREAMGAMTLLNYLGNYYGWAYLGHPHQNPRITVS